MARIDPFSVAAHPTGRQGANGGSLAVGREQSLSVRFIGSRERFLPSASANPADHRLEGVKNFPGLLIHIGGDDVCPQAVSL